MLKLDIKTEPYWIDLGKGIRVNVRPASTPLIRAVRSEIAKQEMSDGDDSGREMLFLKTLARFAIIGWEGVGDSDGNPIEPTPEYVNAFMDIWLISEAFEKAYLWPMLLLDAEKNG